MFSLFVPAGRFQEGRVLWIRALANFSSLNRPFSLSTLGSAQKTADSSFFLEFYSRSVVRLLGISERG